MSLELLRALEPARSMQTGPGPLTTVVRELLRLDADELGGLFADAERRDALLRLTAQVCDKAAGDPGYALELHRVLHALYDLHLKIPKPGRAHPQFAGILADIAGFAERAFLADLERSIDLSPLDDMPREPGAFRRWLTRLIHAHPAYKHPYYTDFLAQRAGLADLRRFFVDESTIDARLDDILALLQLGTSGGVKLEIGRNFWDEIGNGTLAATHTVLFTQALADVGIDEADLDGAASLESLVCGNLSVLLALHRRHFHKAIGYYAVTEYLVPDRFQHIVTGWRRNGLSEQGLEYHRLHIRMDAQHASGWLNQVISPLVEAPDVRRPVAIGALYRLETSHRYLEGLAREPLSA
ncbi:iron-containing redox enzyme family protein [Nannocystis bainbridge]|uniref:Iron-containing redox enzyme family protein n=1 Tax=Nannocystis bainbridge TaxID=2995303 RepID=A0ABT5E2U4_9BACT|nr:iron-containing redox enzyme family protein [Nannocystis bainbridge]MDC0719072.1 iron-containing redox enzyme family protein [Nannocystis bainbridge]